MNMWSFICLKHFWKDAQENSETSYSGGSVLWGDRGFFCFSLYLFKFLIIYVDICSIKTLANFKVTLQKEFNVSKTPLSSNQYKNFSADL